MQFAFGVRAFAKEFILFNQPDLLGHAAQEKPEFFQRGEGLADVVVSAKLHRLYRCFHRTVAGHDRDFCSRQQLFYFFQELESRHSGHNQVSQDDVRGLLLEQCQCRIAAISFHTNEAQALPNSRTKLPDALLVIHDQEANAQIFSHSAFPIVCWTTEISC